ncbi:MAG TPA: Gldg family protein, partial [bacterium]
MMTLPRFTRSALPPVAGVLIYTGERVLAPTAGRWVLTGLGAVALLAAIGWTVAEWRRAKAANPAQAGAWGIALLPLLAFLLAAIVYGVTFYTPTKPPVWPKVNDVLGFAWALLLSIGTVWFLIVESAMWSQGQQALDSGRVRRASVAGLNLGLLLAIMITVNYAVNRSAWQWDVTYFKTTEPSQATRDAVKALDVPVQVGLFFPDGDEVGQLAAAYFKALLTSQPGNFTVNQYDADLNPQQAQDFKARGNGAVILKRDEQMKPIQLGNSLERARGQLKKFDGDILAAVNDLSRERRQAYYTVGHGERNERNRDNPESDSGVSTLETQLRGRGYLLKPLGLAQGLGSTVPDDAALVLIAGPTEPFSKAEGQALKTYLDRGGKVLLFLDPLPASRAAKRATDGLVTLLESYGVKYDNVIEANDRIFARRTFTPADFALLVTTAYGAHPVSATVRKAPDQFPLLFLTAGGLSKGKEPEGMQVREVVKTMPGTWGDRNENFRFDGPPEVRADAVLAMAVSAPQRPKAAKGQETKTPGGGQLLVFSDADVASDLLMQNRANAVLIADGIAWLGGDDAPA